MHDVAVALKIAPLFHLANWRAGYAFLRAMAAHGKGDEPTALAEFGKAMRAEALQTSEYMAFYALLFMLSRRPPEQALGIWSVVADGQFRQDTAASRYAEAFAEYMVAFLTSREDVTERWRDARGLRPSKGFAARELLLPDDPVFEIG